MTLVSLDSETRLIRPGVLAPRLVCVGRATDELPHGEVLVGRDADAAIWHSVCHDEITTANGVFDFGVFCARMPDLIPRIFEGLIEGRYHDVQTRQKLIDLGNGEYRKVFRRLRSGKLKQLGYSLDDLTQRHFRFDLDKSTWRMRYGELEGVPLEQWPQGAIDYARTDPAATLAVHHAQEGGVNLHNEAEQMRAHWALHLASLWGFWTDAKHVDKVLQQIQVDQIRRRTMLIEHGLVRFDHSRDLAAAKRRMRDVAAELHLTDKGQKLVRTKAMTREQALDAGYFKLDEERCEATNDKLLIEYATYGQFQLLRSKILALRTNVPIQTSFEVLLETGRTSSSARKKDGTKQPEEGSAAIQNPPRAEGYRECFIPGKGMVLASCDYNTAELVSLAQICFVLFGFSKLRDALNAGLDPHTDFASQLLGQSYEETLAGLEIEGHPAKEARDRAKVWNFGAPGGLGDKAFVQYARGLGVELTIQEVRRLRKAWMAKWPEMRLYFKYINAVLERTGKDFERDDGTLYKRGVIVQYMSNRIRAGVSYTEACNSMFQGLTADAAKAAMFEVSRHCYAVPSSPLFGCRIVNFVHDELILELVEARAHEAAMELERIMISVYQRYTPDVRINAKATLMRRWTKKAKRQMREGRLVPYEALAEAA